MSDETNHCHNVCRIGIATTKSLRLVPNIAIPVVGLHSCDVQIENGVPDVIVPEVSEFEQSNETQAPEVLWLIRYDHNS